MFNFSTANGLFTVKCKFTLFPSCSGFKMSYLHFQIACYIIFYILILVENIYIDLLDDAMQGFCSLS